MKVDETIQGLERLFGPPAEPDWLSEMAEPSTEPDWLREMADPVPPKKDVQTEEQRIHDVITMIDSLPRDEDWHFADPDDFEHSESNVMQGWWSKARESAKRGYQQGITDVAIYMALQKGDPEAIQRAIAAKDKVIANESQNPIEANWLQDFFYSNVRTAGTMWGAVESGGKGAALVGGAGMIVGGIIGGLIPTVGEEPATITAGGVIGLKAGAKLGLAEGAALFAYRQGVGEMYYEMVKNGNDPEIANTVASIAAIPYALIEVVQLKTLAPNIKKAVNKRVQASVTKILAESAKKYGTTWGKEVGEEVLQKVTSVAARETAAVLSENEIDFDVETIKGWVVEVVEAGLQSAKSMALLPLPGTVIEAGIQTVGTREYQKAQEPEAKPEEKAPAKPVEAEVAEEKPEAERPVIKEINKAFVQRDIDAIEEVLGEGVIENGGRLTQEEYDTVSRMWHEMVRKPEDAEVAEEKPEFVPTPIEVETEEIATVEGEPGGGLAWQQAMRQGIKQSQEIRPTIEVEKTEERGKRAGAYEALLKKLTEQGVKAEVALQRAKSALKGVLTDYRRFEPLDNFMSQEAIDNAYIDIREAPHLKPHERHNAGEALTKMREGYVLTPYEIELLKKWQPQLADVFDQRLKRTPLLIELFANLEKLLGLLKFSAAFDVQMRRQARWLRARFPKIYLQGIAKNLEGYVSQKRADKMAREVQTNPRHEQAKKYGLQFLEREPKGDVGKRPEQYISYLGEKIPILGRFYKASMRGFVDAFNYTQQSLWDYFVNKWQLEGADVTHDQLEALAEFCNTFMGMQPAKSSFGLAARRVLAPVMWSPTLTWSRIRSPEMILTNKGMRYETAKTLGSYIGSGVMMMLAASTLARLLKKDDPIEWDPRSTDFGKIQVQNTRIDVYGDGGPYIRALAQFMMQGKKNQAGRIRRDVGIEPLKQMLRNKRAPFLDLVAMIWTQRNYYGGPAFALPDWAEMKEKGGMREVVARTGEKITEPKVGEIGFYITREVMDSFAPFFIQGAVEAAWVDGWPIAMWAGTEEFFSGSTLSYEPSNYSKAQILQDQTAEERHGKLWEELSPNQQAKIRRDVPEIGDYEEKSAFERMPRKELKLSEMNKSSKEITTSLSKDVRAALDESQVRIPGLGRKWGEFWLNDRRYAEYKKRSAREINKRLSSLIEQKRWPDAGIDIKTRRIKDQINIAKQKVRDRMKREMERGTL